MFKEMKGRATVVGRNCRRQRKGVWLWALGVIVSSSLIACSSGNDDDAQNVKVASVPLGDVRPLIETELRKLGHKYDLEGEPVNTLEIGERLGLRFKAPPDATAIEVETVQGRVSIPVTTEVFWEVDGQVEHSESNPNGTYRLDKRANGLFASFLFRPIISGGGAWPPEKLSPRQYVVRVTLALTADVSRATPSIIENAQSMEQRISHDVDVDVPQTGLPLVVALFIDRNFGIPANAGAYVLVRGRPDVGVACSKLAEALEPVSRAIDVLKSFGDFTVLFLGFERVDFAIRSDHSRCRSAFSVINFFEDPLDPGGILGWGHVTAEDSMSSLVILGGEGAQTQFFNDRGHDNPNSGSTGAYAHNPTGGFFTITVGPRLVASVPFLRPDRIAQPPEEPSVDPPSEDMFVINMPPRSRHGVFGVDSFNDELSAAFFPGPGRELVLRR